MTRYLGLHLSIPSYLIYAAPPATVSNCSSLIRALSFCVVVIGFAPMFKCVRVR